MKKETPILFSTPMVEAILSGTKTVTRRIVKFRNKKWKLAYEANEEGRTDLDAFGVWDESGNNIEIEEGTPGTLGELNYCPYGKVGDLLWVREKWCHNPSRMTGPPIFYYANNDNDFRYPDNERWKPSIHMNKEYSRIWLEIEDIKVERLNIISDEDIFKEGLQTFVNKGRAGLAQGGDGSARDAFRILWESINGPKSWESNPWVWAVSFIVVSKAGKP